MVRPWQAISAFCWWSAAPLPIRSWRSRFGVPALWTRLAGNTSAPQTMGEFEARGIQTNTGRLAARDATIQVLILPVLLVVWGLAIAVIAALVR